MPKLKHYPSAGDIMIKGKSVIDTAPNKRNVKMAFQHLALFPMMNVYENIAYGLRCNGMAKAEISNKVSDVLDRIALIVGSGLLALLSFAVQRSKPEG